MISWCQHLSQKNKFEIYMQYSGWAASISRDDHHPSERSFENQFPGWIFLGCISATASHCVAFS
jgi:hypothetical protein